MRRGNLSSFRGLGCGKRLGTTGLIMWKPGEGLHGNQDEAIARVLAQGLFRDMQRSGVSTGVVLGVASELIALVTSTLRADAEAGQYPADTTVQGP
jgi:hypothetical protein